MADEPALWSCDENDEHLSCTDKNDAIELHLDNMLSPGMTAAEVAEALPTTVVVYGYARLHITGVRDVLSNLLETLDEDYGSPDGEGTDPTPVMLIAEKAFIDLVLAEYVPWACEQVTSETVDVGEWVREYRPDWMEDDPTPASADGG